jgi:CBS domain-containing protein
MGKNPISRMRVKDLLVRDIVGIDADATALEALDKMFHERVSSLFVRCNDSQSYGIVTERDIMHQVIVNDRDPGRVRVSEMVSMPLIAVSKDLSVENVARLMAKTRMERFPVMDGEDLVGLVSNGDILRASVSFLEVGN